MPKAPTTYESARNSVRSEREALTLCAVLPNLPDDERIIDLRGYVNKRTGKRHFETRDEQIEEFKRIERPIVPGTDLYRVHIALSSNNNYIGVKPVPHGRRTYRITRTDFSEFVPVDVEDAEYEDAPYHTLTEYSDPATSPYFSKAWILPGDYARKPHLPV